MMRRKRDWLAYYNDLLEKHGENIEIGTLHILPDGSLSRRFRYQHNVCDGVGAMIDGLRGQGYTDSELPQARPRKAPPFLTLLRAIARFLYHELWPVPPLRWTNRPPLAGGLGAVGPAIHIFDEAETSALHTRAKKQGVLPTNYLLHALAAATRELWLEPSATTRWHIPVSIRGKSVGAETLTNQLTNYVQEIAATEDPHQIQRRQFQHLRDGDPYASWFFLNLGDVPGFGGLIEGKIRSDYRKPSRSPRITGTFSSLGPWPVPGAPDRMAGEMVVPYGNVSLRNPICLVNMVWRGRWTFGLQAHTSICTDEGELWSLRDRIVEHLRITVPKEMFDISDSYSQLN